jgi:hypothetical protein
VERIHAGCSPPHVPTVYATSLCLTQKKINCKKIAPNRTSNLLHNSVNHARSSVDPNTLLAIYAARIEGIGRWVLRKSALNKQTVVQIHQLISYARISEYLSNELVQGSRSTFFYLLLMISTVSLLMQIMQDDINPCATKKWQLKWGRESS